MRRLIATVTRMLGALWDTGNLWGGIGILFFLGWPIIVAVLAAMGADWRYVIGIGSVPLFVGVLVFAGTPVLFWLLSIFSFGRKAIRGLTAVLIGELLWTAYCLVVPVENSWELLAYVMLAGAIYGLASIGVSRGALNVRIGAIGAIFVITLLFFIAEPRDGGGTDLKVSLAVEKIERARAVFKEIDQAFDSKKRPDSIKLYPDTWDFPIPFEVGKSSVVIQAPPADGFVREESGWKIRGDIDADQLCKIVFADGTEVIEGPGLRPDYESMAIDEPFFRIIGISGPGVAKVSVWKASTTR